MSIKVGICGTGAFAKNFIKLFKHHPEVAGITLADLNQDLLREVAGQFETPKTCPSLDELCQSDVDAVAIFTQNDCHAPQAIQALRSGKHVYSAVPSAITMDEISELVRTVEETGKIYMIGETSYYYPCAIYCRERYRKGDFGRIVYSEAEYLHDFDHGLYEVFQRRFGGDWRKEAGTPPMFYPTHSTSLVVSVTGAHVVKVCGMGIEDRHEDGLFGIDKNRYGNPFSNEVALCRMSDGSLARINEFRRVGHPGEVRMRMFGTSASYEEQYNSRIWVDKTKNSFKDLGEILDAREDVNIKPVDSDGVGGEWEIGQLAKIQQNLMELPREYKNLGNGHRGSHQFLIHEFVSACVAGVQPVNNVWQAARYLVPGLVAHQSAMNGGQLMDVPDFGDQK
jgi:predicted dehydrogenase